MLIEMWDISKFYNLQFKAPVDDFWSNENDQLSIYILVICHFVFSVFRSHSINAETTPTTTTLANTTATTTINTINTSFFPSN